MRCEQSGVLLHAFLDGEVDARHEHEFEAHLTLCPQCAADLRDCRKMRRVLSQPEMRYRAPAGLRRRIEGTLPPVRVSAPRLRSLIEGFTVGTMMSAALAASLVMFVLRGDQDQLVNSELVSAYLRSLQSGRLIDVQSSDQHTVKHQRPGSKWPRRWSTSLRKASPWSAAASTTSMHGRSRRWSIRDALISLISSSPRRAVATEEDKSSRSFRASASGAVLRRASPSPR